MANELYNKIKMAYSDNDVMIKIDHEFIVDITGDDYVRRTQNIGTTPESFTVRPDIGIDGFMYIRNMDTTNFALLSISPQTLAYDGETGAFTTNLLVTGTTSKATGWIGYVQDSGKTGTLIITETKGTFQDDELIFDTSTGSATLNGTAGFAGHVYFGKLKAGESCLIRYNGYDTYGAKADTSSVQLEYFMIEE